MYRSEHILKGLSNQYYRATYKSMGFTTEDLKRPIIGIANAWSECVPGHYNLRQKRAAVRCQHDQIFQCTAVINKQLHFGKTVFLAEIQLNPIGWIRRIRFIFFLSLVVANNKILVVIMACVTIDDQ